MFRSATEHVDSYYAASSRHLQTPRPALDGPVQAHLVVVGAGLFGLNTALELARAGRRVVVLEASRVGWGASGRNGGQMNPGYPCDMQTLRAALGAGRARTLFDLSRQALREMRGLMTEHAIDCDLRDGHLEVAVLPRRVGLLQDWIEECEQQWGFSALRFVPKPELPAYVDSARYQAGVFNPEAAHIHPLKYVLGLARAAESLGVRIFEGSRVDGYREQADHLLVDCGPHTLRCDQLVLAANAYIDRVDRRLASRVLPVGTFIGATAPLGEERARRLIPQNHAVYDNQFILEYFRLSADHRLLFGGKCTYLGGTPPGLKDAMKRNLLRTFPQLADVTMDHAWGGHIDITPRRLPDWGRRGDRVFWAQGFCGHGLVPTRIAATLVSQAALGRPEQLDWFRAFVNPPVPGNEFLGGLMQAVGMSWYRLRDIV